MKKQNQGFITLSITSILLIVALAYSLSSYRGVFYQIKVAKNEVEARQAHWKAEGGLECGYSHMIANDDKGIPTTLNSDCSWIGLNSLQASASDTSVLVAQSGSTRVSKALKFSAAAINGAIKSTSNLVVFGSTLVSPPDPGKLNKDSEYECVTAVVSNYMIATGITNNGVGTHISKPSADFDNSYDCAASHKTNAVSNSGIWQDSEDKFVKTNVLEDFQRIKELNPFKDRFGYERNEWQEVRDHKHYGFLQYSMTGSDVDCVNKFLPDLKKGVPNAVWVTGSCQMNETSLKALKDLQAKNKGTYLFLMMHNGVVAIEGAGTIEGVMFQFNDGFTPDVKHWDSFDPTIKAIVYNHGGPTNFDPLLNTIYGVDTDARLATYLQSGSFKFTGGMAFDTQGQIALFNNALNLQYNSDIDNAFDFSFPPTWKKGTWNDF